MNKQRIELLKKYIEEEPNEPFNIYALATEYKYEEPVKALEYYELLLKEHADYLPTYYHAAETYVMLGMKKKVETTYTKGIELAKQQNELNTLRELQNAYNEYLFDDE